jgi:hypothetical protein
MDANEAANSIARIGKYSIDIRPSHRTTAFALLVAMRKTTPRRSVQTDLPPRLLSNVAAARAVSFTLSPCLINFSLSMWLSFSSLRRENGGDTMARTLAICLLRAKPLYNCSAVSSYGAPLVRPPLPGSQFALSEVTLDLVS